MGIPAFFRNIIKEYPSTHFAVTKKITVDHLFFDFNCLIYHCLHLIKGSQKIEKDLIKKVIEYTAHIIDVIGPTKTVYIALDGPAPRAKMVQQRARRFKRSIEQGFKQYLAEKYDVPDEQEWDSRKISPGTVFMEKLARELKTAIRSGVFGGNGDGSVRITLSDSNIAGEGEHKVIPLVRALKYEDPESTVAIYGLDADLIVLAMATHKSKILILREPLDSEIEKAVYSQCEFLYLSIDAIRQAFYQETVITVNCEIEVDRIFNDYVFLTFLGGNDFVRPICFLNVKEGGLNIIFNVYKQRLVHEDDYLVRIVDDLPNINMPFFKRILEELCKQETKKMKQKQMFINSVRERKTAMGNSEQERLEKESKMTPYEIEKTRFEHLPFYHPDHPLFSLYDPVVARIDYSLALPVWRKQYYTHFFGFRVCDEEEFIKKETQDEFNSLRRSVSVTYLKSLQFCLLYYLIGIPSWGWYYPFRVAPLISDFAFAINRFETVECQFTLGRPFRPFEQLMMIMPLDGDYLLPAECAALMRDPELIEYYPEEIELDAAAGMKYIYSEPILPEIPEALLLRKMKVLMNKKMSAVELRRNRLDDETKVYVWTSGSGAGSAAGAADAAAAEEE